MIPADKTLDKTDPWIDRLADIRVFALVQGALIFVAALWFLMSLTYPFGWDQGIFAWSGGVIVHGGMPYRDAWDIKGPLVYYVYAFSQGIFGVNLWGIRVIDGILLIATTLSIGRSASLLTEASVGRWAGLFFFLWYASNSYWHTAQPDGWAGMVLLLVLSPLLLSKGPKGLVFTTLVGVGVGILTLFKPLYAPFLLLPAMQLGVKGASRRIAGCLTLLLGWGLPIALTAGWFASKGTLDDLIEVYIRWSAAYFAGTTGDHLRGLVDYGLSGRVIAVALPLVFYGFLALWHRRRDVAITLSTWVILVVMAVVLQNRFFDYHWLPILPPVVLLVTCGVQQIFARTKTLALLICAAILLHCLAPIALEELRFVNWIAGRIDRPTYYDGYGVPGNDMRAVRWLKEKGAPGSVYMFGWNSSVPWLSGRDSVSRFSFSMPLLFDDGVDFRVRYRRELLEALQSSPPRYIILGTQAAQILGKKASVDDFPEFADFVRQSYRPVVQFGELIIEEQHRAPLR